MKVTLWGTRGSLPTPGPDTARYGGNTSCVQVEGHEGTMLVLDAGSGIRLLGRELPRELRRVDLLLTHLHMDHIQGLGFFGALYDPRMEAHIWGPASATMNLRDRLMRYLSPPLFPVRLRDLSCKCLLHEVPFNRFAIGEFEILPMLICHPGPTVGYRITSSDGVLAYMPDHEPALTCCRSWLGGDWTSGYAVAEGADLLIHDAQYTAEEYTDRMGWGHSTFAAAFEFAARASVKHFVPFHHDPCHHDALMDQLMARATAEAAPSFAVTPAMEGASFDLGGSKHDKRFAIVN